MKLHKYIIAAALGTAALTATTSCSDFLKESPESNIGPEQVGDSKESVDLWVTGVYSNWLYDMFCWNNFPIVLELDNDYISGPDWLFGSLGAGNFNGDSNIEKLWTGPYNLINDANIAIRYIKKMDNVDEDYKNNAVGELLFQKAFCYYLMVRAFGPIPYYETDVMDGAAFYKPRESVETIYGHITEMLEESASLMYSRDDVNYQTGHVSAGSAAGLLAKVYATMASASMPMGTKMTIRTGEPYETATNLEGDEIKICKVPTAQVFEKDSVAGYMNMDSKACYEKAAYWAKKVIDGDYGIYELSNYANLWSKDNRDASEFMWAIRSANGEEKYCTGVHTYFSGYTETAASEYIVSGGWIGNTNNWYQLFDEDDYRIQQGVRHTWRYYYQESYNGCFFYPQSWKEKVTGYDLYGNYTGNQEEQYAKTGYSYHYNTSYECLAFSTKYDDVENKATQYADSNYPFLRYADVLLIYAEAENELGKQDEAMRYLNLVRERSNAKLMTSVTSQESLRSSIFEERAKEFACEGDRRWDLIRWGVYLQAMNAIGGRDDSDIYKERTKRNLLYPIPTSEINANPYITTNNFGW
ncbi:MAG: RagB/SusD family nutrient uptake outer membrane protein [Bacteroidaceae bacterium]|nr:RagB/SusD family nutrient uptake outer membrane protein [Bacteroidaceae bacterium]